MKTKRRKKAIKRTFCTVQTRVTFEAFGDVWLKIDHKTAMNGNGEVRNFKPSDLVLPKT